MKRIYSLKGRRLFQEVFKRGERFYSGGLRLIVLRFGGNKDLSGNRLKDQFDKNFEIKIGITLGKRYGNAVERNRAKRRIRDICRKLLPEMKKGHLIIFHPAIEFKKLAYRTSRQNIGVLLKKAGII